MEFPAASPHVVAVGGTRLHLSTKGTWASETVWNGLGAGGGGCSTVFGAPSWQAALAGWSGVGCAGERAVADIAADADPYTGVAVADSLDPECEYGGQHWCTLGGTSLASPLIAAVFALAGGSHGVEYPAETLYANAPPEGGIAARRDRGLQRRMHPALTNPPACRAARSLQEAADCGEQAICLSGSGYDGPTGLGSPDGIAAFKPSGRRRGRKPQGRRRRKAKRRRTAVLGRRLTAR